MSWKDEQESMNATKIPARPLGACCSAATPRGPASLQRSLGEAGLRAEVHAADSAEALAKALAARAGDVILAYLGDEAAVRQLVARAHAHDPFAPVVVAVTGGAPTAAAAIDAGARDAVPAADTAHLAAVIEREASAAEQARSAADLAERLVRMEHIVEHVPVMLFSKAELAQDRSLEQDRRAALRRAAGRHDRQDRSRPLPRAGDLYNKVDREVPPARCRSARRSPSPRRAARWHYTSKVPVLDGRGEPISLLGISLDITERRDAELRSSTRTGSSPPARRPRATSSSGCATRSTSCSNPILEVWDDVLVMPIIGVVDSRRTADMVQRLLGEVARTQASFVIVDLTGVEIVDTKTADHLMKLMRKVEIVGARCVLTGIRPAVSETLVDIGVDLGRVTTLRNLKHGLREALRVSAARASSGLADVDLAEAAARTTSARSAALAEARSPTSISPRSSGTT